MTEIHLQPTIQTIDTRISEVTVYPNQASIVRRGTVTLTGKERELVITGLPLTVQTDSVTAVGFGAAARLSGLRVEKVFPTEAFGKRLVYLSQQIRQLEEQQSNIRDFLAALQLQRNFVQRLGENSVERFAGLLMPEKINLGEIKEFVSFLGREYGEYAQIISQRERELQELDKQLEILQQQRQQIQQTAYKENSSSFNVVVAIAPVSSGDFELELSYLVNRAIWTPVYDLRSCNKKQIGINYQAEVRQKTGEDWTGVTLNLSTAKPTLTTVASKLKPWYISSLEQTGASNGKCVEEDVFAELEALLADESDTAKKQDVVEAQKMMAKASKTESAVTLQVEGKSNIFSNAKPHKIMIFSGDRACRNEYVAVPQMSEFAYLEATVKNPSNGKALLPGKANIFHNNMLVSTTQLERVAPGEEFKINLGITENLKIERQLVEREVEAIAKYRRTTYKYKIVVTNLGDRQTSLKLIEQLPIGRHEQIKVRLLATNPPIGLGEIGQLEWLLTLQRHSRRGSKQELYYQFAVEHPVELTVVNLDI